MFARVYRLQPIYLNCLEKKQTKSFLDLLLSVLEDCPDQMTDKDIREEVDTFLFEGHDTSSVAMTMTLILLGLHEDVQVGTVSVHRRTIYDGNNFFRTKPETSCLRFLATRTERQQ